MQETGVAAKRAAKTKISGATRVGFGRHALAAAAVGAIASLGFPGAPGLLLGTTSARALGDAPTPVIDCKKQNSRDNLACQSKRSDAPPAAGSDGTSQAVGPSSGQRGKLTDDQIYAASYALAQAGDFAMARDLLKTAANPDDPRILNYLGFTTRKLGDPETALGYYERALAARPDYAVARSYFGEALIAVGRIGDARAELEKIKTICGGTSCDPYVKLEKSLAAAAG